MSADVIVHSGDISSLGKSAQVADFLSWFGSLPFQYRIFIAGNHDRGLDPKYAGETMSSEWWPGMLANYLSSSPNNYYLSNSGCTIKGVNFWGSPITPWFGGDYWAFNKHRGDDIREVWNQIPAKTDVLITHGPVQGKLDFAYNSREYVGCEQLRFAVRQKQPLLHLCGHIHEGYGHTYDEYTYFFNGSICNLSYDPVNAPWTIDADFDHREIGILNHVKYKDM